MSNQALKAYLQARGFPGNWSRTDEAIRLLEANGFPVSPAIATFIRQFGSLNTVDDSVPSPEPGSDVRHGSGRYEIDPIDVCDDKESVERYERELGTTGLCPVGISYDSGGLLVMDQQGKLYDGSGWAYKGQTPVEVVARLLGGRPTD